MLHIIQYILLVLAYFVELFHQVPDRIGLFTLIIFTIIYKMYFKTMKNLYYTFWTFSGFITIYLIGRIIELLPIANTDSALLVYVLILTLLITECYFLSSPIYYPRVNWWEYDFRYRADIKVYIKKVNSEDDKTDEIEARLSDVRRRACCLSIFEDLNIGARYLLALPDNSNFNIEIMSKRQYSLGRPKTYGVRFILNDEEEDHTVYYSFEQKWKEHKYNKKKMKFIKSDLS